MTTDAAAKLPAARLSSLDAFRGFDIFVMIIVNYLAGMKGIPFFLRHAPADFDGFTLTDVVFPGFLFIVGVSIPFALSRRISRKEATPAIIRHIIMRSAALILLGVLLLNGSERYSAHALLSKNWWMMLMYVGTVLAWNIYPKTDIPRRKLFFTGLRISGALLLAALIIIFRGESNGKAAWLQHSWWGILGIIGWSYLAASLFYLSMRGSKRKLLIVMLLLVAAYLPTQYGLPGWLKPVNSFISLGSFATHTAIVLAGTVAGICLMDNNLPELRGKCLRFMLFFGSLMLAGGFLLRPLSGFSKIRCTDSFALATSGICCLGLLLFYYLIEIQGWKKWSSWLLPIGINPLLAYILPGMLGCVFKLTGTGEWFWPYWSAGGICGFLNAAVMALAVLALTAFLTKYRIVLRM